MSTLSAGPRASLANGALLAAPAAIALVMAINTYSYSLLNAIPLVQSDAWLYLDGFLGRFIEHGFSFLDLFAQATYSNTNLPLQKAILFFHTRYYGMDFRLEGLAGTLSAIALVLLLCRSASARRVRDWGTAECWLLASLALVLLSLNSTNVYTWPLATLWFLPVLLAVGYFWFVFRRYHDAAGMALAGLAVGLLLDEVAFPVFLSALGATLVAFRTRPANLLRNLLAFGLPGLLASRVAYWLVALWRPPEAAAAFAAPSWSSLWGAETWKAVLIPLGDSLVHASNLPVLLDAPVNPAAGWVVGGLLLVAHGWFWWRIAFGRAGDAASFGVSTLLAAALMLLFYGLVAGIVLQRVPEFGFDYLHQPRYVLFYQLNLAALALLVYRDHGAMRTGPKQSATSVALVALILLLALLQQRMSTLAWEHSKYLSTYVAGVARTMGEVASDPESDRPCADIMTICRLPPEKRRELMDRLVRYRLNVFSPDFQAFHRLSPYPPTVPVQAGPAGESR